MTSHVFFNTFMPTQGVKRRMVFMAKKLCSRESSWLYDLFFLAWTWDEIEWNWFERVCTDLTERHSKAWHHAKLTLHDVTCYVFLVSFSGPGLDIIIYVYYAIMHVAPIILVLVFSIWPWMRRGILSANQIAGWADDSSDVQAKIARWSGSD